MMGISWMELMVVVMVALIVIGRRTCLLRSGRWDEAFVPCAAWRESFRFRLISSCVIDVLWRDVEDAAQDSAPMRASPRAAGEAIAASRPSPAPDRAPALPETAAPKIFAPQDADP